MRKLSIFILIIFAGLIFVISPYYLFLTKTLKISLIKTLFSLDSLKSYNDQVNILALGIAGGSHEGPNLSDSIIVINYNLKTNQLTTISLPRDIWSITLQDKINTAYAYGEARQKGGGISLAKAEIETIVKLPIQYAMVIDFEKFKDLINLLGDIDVNIERSFVDNEFPIAGRENDLCNGDLEFRCRYQTISFTAGLTHMDGETALKFVRSRHAQGDEGSDFARAKRQQKVIEAVKNKFSSLLKQRNLSKIEQVYSVFDQLITRDITNQQLAIIFKNILFKSNFQQKQIVLTEDFFIVPDYAQYQGKYVLIPVSGDFGQIQSYINCNINSLPNCDRFKK